MQSEIKKALGIFIAIAGLVGVVAQVIASPTNVRAIALLILFATMLLLGIWIIAANTLRNRKASRALPRIEQLEDICVGYTVAQATSDEIEWIARLEGEVYSPADAIPKHVLTEWFEQNPSGFSIIRMSDGQKVGHIDILPLRPSTQKAFLEGHLVEKDIRGDSLYAPSEKDLIRDLYVESIIVLPPKGFSKAPAIRCVLTNFASLVARISDPSSINKIYAIAASKAGEQLLRRLGFDPIGKSDTRVDHHDLFAVRFSDLAKTIEMMCGFKY